MRQGQTWERHDLLEEVGFVQASDGQRLALTEIRRHGAGVTGSEVAFLLVHGFAQNRKGFTLGPMPASLIDRGARVFLGELRGHGDSRVDPTHSWSMQTHLEQDCPALLDGVRERAGVEQVHLVGHSMGGLLGCALLERDPKIASLLAAATPLLLGAARPLVRLASFVVGPLATVAPRPRRVPMDLFLSALATPLSRAEARGPLWLFQQLTRLVNPDAAAPAALREILATADPESPAVMEELARNAVLVRPRLAGVDLVRAVRGARQPIAAIVGTRDIFAPRAAVAPLEKGDHAGPRKIIEVPGGTHVDAIMGDHVPDTIDALWDFLVPRAAE
jgi:pimeloyl-ACP methyl ester carboxylesterase